MGAKTGYECKLYIDDESTYASPSWSEVTNAKDVTLNLEKGEADVTTRGNNGWKATIGTLKDASVDLTMVWDTSDANFTAIRTAFIDNDLINVAAMDGGILVTGSQGLRAMMTVSKFTRNEPLEDAVTVDVTLKVAYFPADPPEWLVVS